MSKKYDVDDIKQEKSEATFTKTQILTSKKYKHRKDIVNVVLNNSLEYTLKEVDELIENFMRRKVN